LIKKRLVHAFNNLYHWIFKSYHMIIRITNILICWWTEITVLEELSKLMFSIRTMFPLNWFQMLTFMHGWTCIASWWIVDGYYYSQYHSLVILFYFSFVKFIIKEICLWVCVCVCVCVCVDLNLPTKSLYPLKEFLL
jgi:hypothetical protein